MGTQKFYEVFTKLLHVTKRVIRCYLHSLRRFFSVGIKDGLYYITLLHSVFAQEEEKGKKHRSMNILRKSSAGETRFIMTRQS